MYILMKETISITGENDPFALLLLPLLVAQKKKREPTADETAAASAAIHPKEISTAAR